MDQAELFSGLLEIEKRRGKYPFVLRRPVVGFEISAKEPDLLEEARNKILSLFKEIRLNDELITPEDDGTFFDIQVGPKCITVWFNYFEKFHHSDSQSDAVEVEYFVMRKREAIEQLFEGAVRLVRVNDIFYQIERKLKGRFNF